MNVVARDAVAADQLVYPYPYPLGPQVSLSCGADEVVVVCPAWAVAGLLGPGHHQYLSPEPGKPLMVYFVLTGPVEVPFDMVSHFALPGTAQQVTVRATGSVLVRVADPGMLIAQFVGLPFDHVNYGLMSSVSASVERLLGKVLPRKIAHAGTPRAVTERAMWPALADELAAYNPTTGSVFGLQFVRFATLEVNQVGANLQPQEVAGWVGGREPLHEVAPVAPMPAVEEPTAQLPAVAPPPPPPIATNAITSSAGVVSSGEIGGGVVSGAISSSAGAVSSGEIGARPSSNPSIPSPVSSGAISSSSISVGEISSGEIGGAKRKPTPAPAVAEPAAPADDGQIIVDLTSAVVEEPASNPALTPPALLEPPTYPVGSRVLVALADGLLHSATVRQSMQGYYELEVGGAELPLWVPGNSVAPQM